MTITSLLSVALLALPVFAQDPVDAKAKAQDASVTTDQAEVVFLKAFYLERGPSRRYAEAIEQYKKFLDAAPASKYAGDAAKYAHNLIAQNGKPEDVEAFKTKYAAVLKNVDLTQPVEPAGQGQRGGRGQGGQGGQGRMGGANLDDLRAQLEKAKTDKDEAKVKQLTDQIAQIEARRAGGQGGRGGRGMFNPKPIPDMTDDELKEYEAGLQGFDRIINTLRDNGQGENADKATALVKKIKDSLTAGKKDDAEAARKELTALMPRGRRGGGGN